MSGPLEKLKTEKAKALAEAAEAEARAKEIDGDMARLQEAQTLAAKYGLTIVEKAEPNEDLPESTVEEPANPEATAKRSKASPSQQSLAILAAEEIIRAEGQPVNLDRLFELIIAKGVRLGGAKPRSTLSAYLSNSTQIESIRKGWWWLRSKPVPSAIIRLPNGKEIWLEPRKH